MKRTPACIGSAAEPAIPEQRRMTVRQALRDCLLASKTPCTAEHLSRAVGIPLRRAVAELEHVQRSLAATGETLRIEAAACDECGFVFANRHRLARPGKCPRCGGARINPPRFWID